ncbi:tetraspanin-9 isoform X2 [Eurosta solidaginis]
MEAPFSSATLWKYVLLVLSCLITVVTMLLISCGVIALGSAGSVVGAYTAASVGFFAMFIAFVGAMAAVRQSLVLSWGFIVSTVFCIVLQTICMIIFGIFKDDFEIMATKRVQSIWDGRPGTLVEMDDMQMQYHCCGVNGAEDYLTEKKHKLPDSCCLWENCSNEDRISISATGCSDAAKIYFDNQSDNLVLIIVGLIALQVSGVIAAYYFTRSMGNLNQKREKIVITE